jgi:hypothetical protein
VGRAVRDNEDPLLGRVLPLEGHDLGVQGEPEVAVVRAGEHPPGPLEKRSEIGILKAGSETDEDESGRPA